MIAPAQDALFDAEPAAEAPVTGVPAGQFSTAPYDAALAGDGYGWLVDMLGSPQSSSCERCGQPMRLPAAAPVLWACPACHPREAS
jgi:hypothetical protein